MNDPYAYWKDALDGKFGPVHDGDPQPGFYRKRKFKNGPWQRVAIWPDTDAGGMQALVDNDPVDPSDIWTWCCQNPITEAVYRTVETGGQWPDEPPAAPGIGHNMPGDDPHDALKAELAGEQEIATEFLGKPVEIQEDADKAAVWAKRVADIGKRAEEHRKTEKAPILEAGRAVDAKWNEVVTAAKDLTARLKKHVEPFLIAKKREEEERARKAREEADRLRREAAEADEAARAEALKKADETEKVAAAKNSQAGRTGARVALRTVYVAVITDYDACYAALKDHPDMRAFVQQLADRACRAKVPLAGVEYQKEERAA